MSAVIKIVLALLVGGLGVWYISRYGFVNDMSARTFLPSFDLNSLSYISVIIFNFLGFEVVCTYANNMSDPKKQIPQSIVTGGIVIAAIYLFSAFGIGAAVDVREISVDSGLIDAVSLILGGSGGVEAVITASMLRDQFVPPTAGYQVPDENCDLDICPNEGKAVETQYALSNSLGFGGHNATLLFRRV